MRTVCRGGGSHSHFRTPVCLIPYSALFSPQRSWSPNNRLLVVANDKKNNGHVSQPRNEHEIFSEVKIDHFWNCSDGNILRAPTDPKGGWTSLARPSAEHGRGPIGWWGRRTCHSPMSGSFVQRAGGEGVSLRALTVDSALKS